MFIPAKQTKITLCLWCLYELQGKLCLIFGLVINENANSEYRHKKTWEITLQTGQQKDKDNSWNSHGMTD